MAVAHQKACPGTWPALPRRQEAAESPNLQDLEARLQSRPPGGSEKGTGMPAPEGGHRGYTPPSATAGSLWISYGAVAIHHIHSGLGHHAFITL